MQLLNSRNLRTINIHPKINQASLMILERIWLNGLEQETFKQTQVLYHSNRWLCLHLLDRKCHWHTNNFPSYRPAAATAGWWRLLPLGCISRRERQQMRLLNETYCRNWISYHTALIFITIRISFYRRLSRLVSLSLSLSFVCTLDARSDTWRTPLISNTQ